MHSTNPRLLAAACSAWQAAAAFRERRSRFKNFTYGDQWGDLTLDADRRLRREDDVLLDSGRRPVTNNLIRQMVKTVVGRYRARRADAAQGHTDSGPMAEIAARNDLDELDARMLEEFLISGCAVQRVVDERRFCGCGVWVDNVDPRRLFFRRFSDPRGLDIELIGMLHDMSMPEVISRFAAGSSHRADRLRHIFAPSGAGSVLDAEAAVGVGGTADSTDFFTAAAPDRCRVVEVWTFDCRHDRTTAPEFFWKCHFLAPDGTILDSFASPYPHGGHPFVLRLYPLTDGEIHPFVEDVIDQQKYINRLVVMIDHIMASSAKGALLFPLDQLADNYSINDIARYWNRPDAVIPVSGKGVELPRQLVTQAADAGAYSLLSLQMKLFDRISGVGDSLLGRVASAGTGAELYNCQVENATLALADIFRTYEAFIAARDTKIRTSR